MNNRTLSLVAFGLAVAGIVPLIVTDMLVSHSAAGLAVQGLALALMIWARFTFGRRSFHAGANPTEGGLVTRGPYRYLRHPIYAAVIYFVWAGVLSNISPISAGLAALVTLGMGVRMVLEERLLVAKYPEYAEYAASTKRVIPFVV
jgi:protein-S-isoprenylcysteine O-methyltransferase Ste14